MTRYSLDAVWSGRYWHGAGGAMYSNDSMIAALNEHFESFTEVLGMGEGLELFGVRLSVTVPKDTREKCGLCNQRLGHEPSHFAKLLQRSEEYIHGDVL